MRWGSAGVAGFQVQGFIQSFDDDLKASTVSTRTQIKSVKCTLVLD